MDISSEFYETNYLKFSDTRFCLWDVVRKFGEQFTPESRVLDAGCGNGKNMKYFDTNCRIVGIDKSKNLTGLCIERGYNVQNADINNIPHAVDEFDYIMCIAVLHHIDNEVLRVEAIHEMLRVLKPGGQLLVTVWAYESDLYSTRKNFTIGDNIVKFNNDDCNRYYYIYDKDLFEKTCGSVLNVTYDLSWDRGNWNVIFTKNKYCEEE
jgi:alkylated DNA repair protein alkB family protein 8